MVQIPKRGCPICQKQISYTNFSRHMKFQHQFCQDCSEFHSLKKHTHFQKQRKPQANENHDFSTYTPVLVPIYFPTQVLNQLTQMGLNGDWMKLVPNPPPSTQPAKREEVIKLIQDGLLEENRINCPGCTSDTLAYHSCCDPDAEFLMKTFFDKVCRDQNIQFQTSEEYEMAKLDVHLTFYI